MKGTLNEILSKGPKFEENILKAFENRQLVFFIGAGVSRIMGIMGWDDFSAFLVRKAFPDFKDNNPLKSHTFCTLDLLEQESETPF